MAIANPERGEVGLRVVRGDEDKEYVLKLSVNAAAAMQKKLGKPFGEIVRSLEKMDFEVMRELTFMLLQKHHRAEIKTLDQAGDLIEDAGGMGAFSKAFTELATMNAKAVEDGTGANPQTAQAAEMSSGGSTSQPDATA